jgi:dTDP-4-amino-4,6-dideoxygalactose transaminase
MPSPAVASPPKPVEPFLPLTRPTIDDATIAGVGEVLRSGWISSGPQVKAFEARLSEYFGGRPVRVFNSGTCTMEIALRIAGVGPGDEVITTPLSWVATSNVVLAVGARPVFVDIDPVTRTIDLGLADAAVTPRTKAIIPIDLAGLPVDRDRLYAIARGRGLRVVEDAAQALGSTWRARRIGSFGDFVSFSFHANKNITTSEGGCLVMSDESEARLAEQYRLQGVVRTGHDGMDVALVGGKFNMTDVAARIGLGQMPHLDAFTARRRELARAYFEEFDRPAARSLGLGLPVRNFTDSNWHMFQVILPEGGASARRADVMEAMRMAGIGTGVHYPAIHLFALYRSMGWKPGDFPHAERAGRTILTLPLFPAMKRTDVTRVVRALASILGAHRKA